jgi:tRNA dimethylallyltransferase
MKRVFSGEIFDHALHGCHGLGNKTVPSRPLLRVITGPTAVGKTEWALRWAEAHGAEIVSCDSLLFYRGMDIGTAKPTAAERARVPHHLIDVCEVTDRMDITDYVRLARQAVNEILGRGRAVLIVGGSGFYLKAFFAPIADDIEVPAAVREEVAALPLGAAVARLRALNPAGLGALDTANPRRVARALERCIASGRTVEALAREFAQQPGAFADFDLVLTRIERGPEDLAVRIEQRVGEMLRTGLVDEVRRLRVVGLEQNASAAKAIGYREVLAMFDGELGETALAAEIAKNTRALVKKQRTWFRTQLPPHREVRADLLRHATELFPE